MGLSTYLTFEEGSSNKFWQCHQDGSTTTVKYGKIGSSGQSLVKNHKDAAAAVAYFKKQKAEKKKKGYKEGTPPEATKPEKAPAAKKAPKKAAKKPPMKKKTATKSDVTQEGEDVSQGSPPKKQKTATSSADSCASPDSVSSSSGTKPVDSLVPNRESYSVYDNYSVKLLQTNLDWNNNKFYMIQLLKDRSTAALETCNVFSTWTRWGRVGERGESKMIAQNTTFQAALKAFHAKFRAKSGNPYSAIADGTFEKLAGKYGLVETDDTEGDDAEADAPLGKLTKAQCQKGQAVLAKLEQAVNKKATKKPTIDALSSEYYSLIPTVTGRKAPPALSTPHLVEQQSERLKFLLRMGFDDLATHKSSSTPVDGVMKLALPPTLHDSAIGAGKNICGEYEIQRCDDLASELISEKKKLLVQKLKFKATNVAAILLYTGNEIYSDLNASLREENITKLKKYYPYLRLFLETFQIAKRAGAAKKRIVWRGVGVDLLNSDYAVGKKVTWWGVSSTTTEQDVAKGFAGSCANSTFFTIEAHSAVDISMMSFYGEEKECLLPPGTQFLVTSAKKAEGMTQIHLKEVGQMIA